MGGEDRVDGTGRGDAAGEEVLGSWKEIAQYLHRDVRTVMRWERTRRMPVHRLPGTAKPPVHAVKSELDAWRCADAEAQRDARERGQGGGRSRRRGLLVGGALAVLILGAALVARTLRSGRSAAAQEIRSVAVLPFQSLANDTGQDYLAAGIQEMLTTELARSGRLHVTARTSVARYAGTKTPVRSIGRELNVDALVEGSVLRSGNRVFVTAQLVRTATEEHVWANKYERDLGDVLSLTDQLATAITAEIRTAARGGEPARSDPAPPSRTVQPEVLDLYLRGRYAYHSLTAEGLASAIALYQKSVALDAGFALAWVGISAARTTQAFSGILPPGEVLPEARAAANRALELDGRLGEAYGHLGYIALYFDRDFDKAGRALTRAQTLSPGSLMVRHEYADYLLVRGRAAESLEQVLIGRDNELPSWPGHGIVLYHALLARRYDMVLVEGQKILAASPNNRVTLDWLARALWLTGRHEEALAQMRTVYGLDTVAWQNVRNAYRARGANAAMLALARWAGAKEPKGRQAGAFYTALLFGAAGDADHALEWLEQSDARREPFVLHAGADPFLDPVRGDPRLEAFLRRLRITPIER